MALDRSEANRQMLAQAGDIQSKTKDAILRIQQQTAETEELAVHTLDELRKQGAQMDDINVELDNVSVQLDKSRTLQGQFDRWAGNWLGGKKNKAIKEAQQEIVTRKQEQKERVVLKEVFENEKFDTLRGTWKPSGMTLCSDPTKPLPETSDFGQEGASSTWLIDYSVSGIDAEGWTYAYDFSALNRNGVGDNEKRWNSYVRRRKWRLESKRAENSSIDSVRERNNARHAQTAPAAGQQQQQQSSSQSAANNNNNSNNTTGYVPRSRQQPGATAGLLSAGMTSAGMLSNNSGRAGGGIGGIGGRPQDQQVDAESVEALARLKSEDVEIDQGLDAISRNLDMLGRVAADMNTETRSQVGKMEFVDQKMTRASDQQTFVNARQRALLKR